jgi:photosystem II stability/assembly factor-like uncharacterized protein
VGTFLTFGKNLEDPNLNGGFLRSSDLGLSWDVFGQELSTLLITEFHVSLDGQTIVGNPRDSFHLQVSEDGGQTWRVTQLNQANGPVAISPTDPSHVLFVTGQRTISLSTDALESFTPVITSESNITDIAFAPSDPTIVYAVTEGLIVCASNDAGASFTEIVNIRTDVLNP